MMIGDCVFPDKNELVNYLYSVLSNPTQIKVQKTLYLLYAFYGATYGQLHKDKNDDEFEEQSYPKELFPAKFQAWKYGPVEFDVYRDEKQGCYKQETTDTILSEDNPEDINIKQFIHEITDQTDEIDDFSLVDRTHQDDVWFDNYKPGIPYIDIKNEDIINEYRKRYIKDV